MTKRPKDLEKQSNQAPLRDDASHSGKHISISTALLKDDQGRILGGAESFRDLSEVEALRQELEGRHMGELVSRSRKMQKTGEKSCQTEMEEVL